MQDADQPVLAIGLENGRLQLMQHETDENAILIDTGALPPPSHLPHSIALIAIGCRAPSPSHAPHSIARADALCPFRAFRLRSAQDILLLHAGLPWRSSDARWGGLDAASRGARWGGVEFASHPRQMYVATSDALYLSDLRAGLGDLLITHE